mmetsp:Transcript_17215/g.38613  ORF Transcript_17215/g.38613 Transcript_17215/m.38613 type:complete len:214 (+) Transcript_17215:508-1149(+)
MGSCSASRRSARADAPGRAAGVFHGARRQCAAERQQFERGESPSGCGSGDNVPTAERAVAAWAALPRVPRGALCLLLRVREQQTQGGQGQQVLGGNARERRRGGASGREQPTSAGDYALHDPAGAAAGAATDVAVPLWQARIDDSTRGERTWASARVSRACVRARATAASGRHTVSIRVASRPISAAGGSAGCRFVSQWLFVTATITPPSTCF